MQKNHSGRERAYAHIRNVILTDPAMIGTFLNERKIAETLEISRTPVREALLILASEELITLMPNRGAFVTPPDLRKITQLLQARGMIEVWSAQYCLQHDIDPTAAMRKELEKQHALPADTSFITFIEHDTAFHRTLIQATGNTIVQQMYESLHARHVIFGVYAMRNMTERNIQVLQEHQDILDAFATRDLHQVRTAILKHLEKTGETFR
ncbi:MAG: Transcriptional regulator [Candidatus Tokpelaia hoelldobleri]|uniref:Transcriptional regulator n=1 Tax=Candidatus Tokpelaia hoelldobleri TaxID=1902579 RepID=A0A1U9JSQ9_9HYPH|nr:MAG: Transcriptional regulator [Candidatus Tokpelaia hoelldoblerii]